MLCCRYKKRDYLLVLAITTGVMLFFLTGRVSAKHVDKTANVVAWGAALMLGCESLTKTSVEHWLQGVVVCKWSR